MQKVDVKTGIRFKLKGKVEEYTIFQCIANLNVIVNSIQTTVNKNINYYMRIYQNVFKRFKELWYKNKDNLEKHNQIINLLNKYELLYLVNEM